MSEELEPTTHREMIFRALESLGFDSKPKTVHRWIQGKYGRNVPTSTISAEKHWMVREYAPQTKNGQAALLPCDNGAKEVQTPVPNASSLADAVHSVKASLEDTLKQLRSAREYHVGQAKEIDLLLTELGFSPQVE